MRFMVYNVEGLTIPVDAEPGVPFTFHCPAEECGRELNMEGEIVGVFREEFDRVLKDTISSNPNFEPISGISVRKYVFRGTVNGIRVELPAESVEDFAQRFVESSGSFIILR